MGILRRDSLNLVFPLLPSVDVIGARPLNKCDTRVHSLPLLLLAHGRGRTSPCVLSLCFKILLKRIIAIELTLVQK